MFSKYCGSSKAVTETDIFLFLLTIDVFIKQKTPDDKTETTLSYMIMELKIFLKKTKNKKYKHYTETKKIIG